MKIRNYLILTFLGIALLIFVFAHISFSSAQVSLEKSISAELETLAVLTMYAIDRDIDGQIESFQLFVTDHSVTKFISNSNQEFEKLDDLENYITEKDNEWVNVPLQEITPFMQNILANELSEKLRLKQEFLSNKYGYKVFGELFITNAYGANIAQTGKTTDYKQNDETWWTEAKENGFFVGAVKYDESAGIFSKDLVIRIEQDGKFLGVMKIVYNIKEISNIIDHVGIDLDKHAKMEIKLLNKEGQIIYSTVDFTIFENAPQDELSQITSQSGSFFITKGSVEEFRAFAVSAEHNGHPDLDLVLLFELETEEILGPIIQLRYFMMTLSAIIASISILVGVLVSRSISNPISKLIHATDEIEKGNLDFKLKPQGSEEHRYLIEAFGHMVESLKEIDRAKTEFLNMISHEFKNPLIPIIGFSKALQKPKLYGEINSKQLESLKKISRNAEELESMINNLLDIQNLESDRMVFDYGKFKVDELMREICKKFESKIIERKIQLVNKTQNSIVIQSDELKIKQVLSHLIDNAIDFVPKENGKIEICVQEADDSVLFFVKDNGVGIPKEKQENLFKKFYQVSQGHTRKHGGVGLGISICKGIVTKLGGKIWVESEPGKGTAFYFNIPKISEGEKMKI